MKRKYTQKHARAFWMFIAPCLLLFSLFFLIPLMLSIGFSFTDFDGWKTMNFIGLKNFRALLSDGKFYDALRRTFIYTIFSLPFKVILPLLLAVMVTHNKVLVKGFARTLIYIPALLSHLVVGITINWLFSSEYGLVNYLLGLADLAPLEWALNPALATFVISFAANWMTLGFYMVIYIGGINDIPRDIYEAAEIDGSGGISTFLRITLPMLAPTMFLVVLLSTVNLLKEYALVQGITQGGPGLRTTFIIQFIFDKGFHQMQYGYASAVSLVVMIIFALVAFIQFKISNGGDR